MNCNCSLIPSLAEDWGFVQVVFFLMSSWICHIYQDLVNLVELHLLAQQITFKFLRDTYICHNLEHHFRVINSNPRGIIYTHLRCLQYRVNLTKLFWHDFTHTFYNLDHFLNSDNNCLSTEKITSSQYLHLKGFIRLSPGANVIKYHGNVPW